MRGLPSTVTPAQLTQPLRLLFFAKQAAMEMQEADFDRLLFFEHARRHSESQYIKNPLDADVPLSSQFPFYFYFFFWVLVEIVVFQCLVCVLIFEFGGGVRFSLLQNLTKWGNALLELSQFQQQSESFKTVQGIAAALFFFNSAALIMGRVCVCVCVYLSVAVFAANYVVMLNLYLLLLEGKRVEKKECWHKIIREMWIFFFLMRVIT